MRKNYADLVDVDDHGKNTYALDAPVKAEYSDDKFLFVWVSRGSFMGKKETAIFGLDKDMNIDMLNHVFMVPGHMSDKDALKEIGATLR